MYFIFLFSCNTVLFSGEASVGFAGRDPQEEANLKSAIQKEKERLEPRRRLLKLLEHIQEGRKQ